MTLDTLSIMAGNIGVVAFLAAFFLLQRGTITHNSLLYLLLNLAGAILLIASLLVHWNVSAFVLEAIWGLISMYGIFKYHIRPKMNTKKP